MPYPSDYDDYDEEENDNDSVIGHYHSQNRNWTVDYNDPTLLGLEIETLFPEDSDMDSIAIHAMDYGKLPIIAEEDGSLDDEGAEFIFKPIPYRELVDGCYIHECVNRLISQDVMGHDAGVGYGLHVNVNSKTMERLHTARFCLFFHRNKTFVEKIARRRENRTYYRYNETADISLFHTLTDKYIAATRRDEHRVEVRVFRSTLCWQTIQATCQFVHSVRIFTEDASVDNLTSTKYLEWLSNQAGYDILNSYLTKRGVSYVPVNR